MHPAALPDELLLACCEVRRTRGSGPGGRHRNSTDSRVVLHHRETGVEGAAGERRSQHENLAVALTRLRLALAAGIRSDRGLDSAPSGLWQSRTRDGRVACNPGHRDFPVLLAEALDVVAAAGWDVRTAAAHLGTSPTQIVRFLALYAPARTSLNRERAARGLAPLRG